MEGTRRIIRFLPRVHLEQARIFLFAANRLYTNHWIPRPSFQTWLYHLGGLFQTPLYYHLHPCRRASMQASLRWNDGGGHYRHLVIPAKTGIQEGGVGMWHGLRFLPVRWNLPCGHSRHAGMNYINHWIPACAGMTTKREKVDCQPDNPSAIPDRCLTSAPAVIYGQEALYAARGHACKDTGYKVASGTGRQEARSSLGASRPPSCRRMPKSSGLNNRL